LLGDNMNTTTIYKKFENPLITAKGEKRASVTLSKLKTLWFNTGTQCNLECKNCYIESSPTNDRLVYLSVDDVRPYMEEIKKYKMDTELIALTGGEPFINPHIIPMLDTILSCGLETLVLTNAYKVLKRHQPKLLELKEKYGQHLHLRISLDHYTVKLHDHERGEGRFVKTLEQIKWLYDEGFNISIAGRSLIDEAMDDVVAKYEKVLHVHGIELKLTINDNIVIFPEMHSDENVPEISVGCWKILDVSPEDQMCAHERMIVKRKGEDLPVVLACTLLAYDKQFELGHTLKDAVKKVYLNHVFCSKFCVLGGASCSSAK